MSGRPPLWYAPAKWAIAVPATDPPYRQRLHAALTRDIATLLTVPADHVLAATICSGLTSACRGN